MMYAAVPSSFSLGLEYAHVQAFWLLGYMPRQSFPLQGLSRKNRPVQGPCKGVLTKRYRVDSVCLFFFSRVTRSDGPPEWALNSESAHSQRSTIAVHLPKQRSILQGIMSHTRKPIGNPLDYIEAHSTPNILAQHGLLWLYIPEHLP